MQTEFFFNKRKYTCQVFAGEQERELQIISPEGLVLLLQPRRRRGFLRIGDQKHREVNLSQPRYFNLIRAALTALELADRDRILAEETQLLREKDQLLAEKNQQIDVLQEQIGLLHQQLSRLSLTQQERFQELQAAMQEQEQVILVQESLIQERERHIDELQSQISQQVTRIDFEDIKYQVKTRLGAKTWNRLDVRSRRDLCEAYRHYQTLRSESFTAKIADYSEAGLRLSFVVEREVVQTFFRELAEFYLPKGVSEVGGINLSTTRKYTLGMLPPLLAVQWYTFREAALKLHNRVSEDELYYTVALGSSVSQGDRQRIKQFLATWEHPLAQWLTRASTAAAAKIDQINRLRNMAAHAESFLFDWQFKMLRLLVMGGGLQAGVLQDVYDT